MQRVSLIDELCRAFHAKRVAVECALRHGQVSVDGHVMQLEFDRRWTEMQLRGRLATMVGRTACLFGAGRPVY